MPIDRPTAVDALHLDAVLTLDLDLGVAVIDLARVSFVDAYALTGLACFIASAARDGLPVRLVLPEHPDVRSWLSRMHLGDVIDTFEVDVGGGLPRVAERDRRDTLIELQRFDDSHGSHRLATFIWERLEGGADGEVVNQLFEATGELGQNVVEHAGSPAGGFVAAQRYKAGAPEERIIVAVGDVGVGIRESLRAPVRRHDRWRGHHGERSDGTSPASWRRAGARVSQGSWRGSGGSMAPSGSAAARPAGRSREAERPRRRVPSARYDCRCSVALPARQVT